MSAPTKRHAPERDNNVAKRDSRIYSPFRVLGCVSNDIPFAVGTLGSTFYIVTSVGTSLQIYDANNLHLLFVTSTQTPHKITAVAAHFHYVFAGYGNQITVYRRGKPEATLTCPSDATVHKIIVFGEFLVATMSDNSVEVFKGRKAQFTHYTSMNINTIEGQIVDVVHPPTYLNKVVVATTSKLFIFNIKTGKLIYKSAEFAEPISALESAPVLDLVAVGTASGGVYLYNLKKGRTLGPRVVVGESRVVSVSFRTDGSPHLVAGLSDGSLFFYDLAKRMRIHVLTTAHQEAHGGVAKAQFLNGQPVVVSNGGDNTLKEWVFDPTISSNSSVVQPPRHLRSRGGHSAPPIALEFPDQNKTHFLYSASRDRSLWSFSLRKDAQAQEMSQRPPKRTHQQRKAGLTANLREKFPEVVAMVSSEARAGDWDNMVTAHKEESFARTWDTTTKRVGKHQLDTVDAGFATAVGISQCGNFALVGSSKGGIGSYNLQSGILRKKYMLHKQAVTGLAMDGFNRKMVSCGLDGIVGFYDFAGSQYLGKLQLDAPITAMVYQQKSDLIALSLDDLSVVIVDVVAQKVVRILYGHTNRITAMDFSPDGRWVVTCGLDSTLRTWDLPTGSCIDGVRLPTVATCVKFSPLGDVLATTHTSGNGIFLWTNRAQFRPVAVRQVDEDEFATMLLPSAAGDGGVSMVEGALDDATDKDGDLGVYVTKKQVDDLLTLASGPRSKFQTIVHMDTIKQRSKAKQPASKPKSAPFFLQLSGEVVGDRAKVAEQGEAANNGTAGDNENPEFEPASRVLALKGDHSFESKFTKLLRQGHESGSYSEFLDWVVAASPPVIDTEIRSLPSFPPLDEMCWFIEAMIEGLKARRDYDVIEAMMHLFMSVHGDVVYNHPLQLEKYLQRYHDASKAESTRAEELVKYCGGVMSFLETI
ncbi:hypothetical protein DIURU_003021 [Diutina rugosa]|uniref:Uncharacterized protein n=1 Tax=Diutina rugosa TaxID=5481 RepID=A0A642UMV3_DIURU|nr:uncharacterized protein DIURU_003021 [Diutina rugosa]KAA8901970.1 hypothetical protein DIURU_003021 [Diutina rugosa]